MQQMQSIAGMYVKRLLYTTTKKVKKDPTTSYGEILMGHTMHYRCMIIMLQPGYSIPPLRKKRT